jgi:hypothetical protein
MRFKNTTLSLKEIASALNVSAIMEGSVRAIRKKQFNGWKMPTRSMVPI